MPEPDLTPTEEQVRRLLADARHDEPAPDDVVARLDGVLADLRAEDRRTDAVVDLATRRRRRRHTARNVLVAAAAVVVLGVGIRAVDLGGESAGDADSSSAGGSALQESESGAGDSASRLLAGPPLVLSPGGFSREVRRAARHDDAFSATEDGVVPDQAAPSPADGCDDPAWGGGTRVQVQYDGQPATLVVRAADGTTQQVDLFLCGTTAPTRTTTIPAG